VIVIRGGELRVSRILETFKRDEKSPLLWIWDAELVTNPQFAAFFVAPKANYNK